jgi:hypothetical protein
VDDKEMAPVGPHVLVTGLLVSLPTCTEIGLGKTPFPAGELGPG